MGFCAPPPGGEAHAQWESAGFSNERPGAQASEAAAPAPALGDRAVGDMAEALVRAGAGAGDPEAAPHFKRRGGRLGTGLAGPRASEGLCNVVNRARGP